MLSRLDGNHGLSVNRTGPSYLSRMGRPQSPMAASFSLLLESEKVWYRTAEALRVERTVIYTMGMYTLKRARSSVSEVIRLLTGIA